MAFTDLPSSKTPHYYGDTVRRLFLIGGAITLIFSPIYPDLTPFNSFFLVIVLLAIALAAGITNPRQYWAVALDVAVSMIVFSIFEYLAASNYNTLNQIGMLFIIRQILAGTFFFAVYFSAKSMRAMYLKNTE